MSGSSITDPLYVYVVEEEGNATVRAQGFFKAKGSKIEVKGNVGEITTDVISFPYDVTILQGYFHARLNHIGDSVSCHVAPNAVVGVIEAPVFAGDANVVVSETVTQNMKVGFNMRITDGVNNNNLGEIVAVNGNIFTVENPPTANFSPLSPTYVQQTITLVDNLHITVPYVQFTFAGKKQRGKGLPKNVPLVIEYHNHSGGEKDFSYVIEFIY